MAKTKQDIVNIIAKEAGLTKKQAGRKIRIPAKKAPAFKAKAQSKEAEAMETKTLDKDKDWLQQADDLRAQIYARLGGYAGDSVKELREIRGARVKGER